MIIIWCQLPYVPESLMSKAFDVIHNDTTAGHKDTQRTIRMFKKNFYNYKETTTLQGMVTNCELCIKAKGIPKMVPIHKYPIPSRPFHTVSSDILGPLPITSGGNTYVITARDFTTRYTVLFPLQHKDAISIINVLRIMISNYGSMEVLITDNSKEYKSSDLSNFCKYYNCRKVEIAPYHPSSQGLAERINRKVTKMLRIYTSSLAVNDWDTLLPVIQLTINNTYNSSLKETPFFFLYGYDSPTVALQQPKVSYDESDLAQHLKRVSIIRQHCMEVLLKAQEQYTSYTNARRVTEEYRVGDRVFAKLDKYLQQKLDLPIQGPFLVVGTKGKAYKLQQIANKKLYVVHPDYIVKSSAQQSVSSKLKLTPIQNKHQM